MNTQVHQRASDCVNGLQFLELLNTTELAKNGNKTAKNFGEIVDGHDFDWSQFTVILEIHI